MFLERAGPESTFDGIRKGSAATSKHRGRKNLRKKRGHPTMAFSRRIFARSSSKKIRAAFSFSREIFWADVQPENQFFSIDLASCGNFFRFGFGATHHQKPGRKGATASSSERISFSSGRPSSERARAIRIEARTVADSPSKSPAKHTKI